MNLSIVVAMLLVNYLYGSTKPNIFELFIVGTVAKVDGWLRTYIAQLGGALQPKEALEPH